MGLSCRFINSSWFVCVFVFFFPFCHLKSLTAAAALRTSATSWKLLAVTFSTKHRRQIRLGLRSKQLSLTGLEEERQWVITQHTIHITWMRLFSPFHNDPFNMCKKTWRPATADLCCRKFRFSWRPLTFDPYFTLKGLYFIFKVILFQPQLNTWSPNPLKATRKQYI